MTGRFYSGWVNSWWVNSVRVTGFYPRMMILTFLHDSNSSSIRFVTIQMLLPLPSVNNPQNHRQHHGSRNYFQSDVDPLTVSCQTGAMVHVNVVENLVGECAVLQLRQERSVVVESVAYVYCSRHLPVECRCQASRGRADSRRRDLTDVATPDLSVTAKKVRLFFHTSILVS